MFLATVWGDSVSKSSGDNTERLLRQTPLLQALEHPREQIDPVSTGELTTIRKPSRRVRIAEVALVRRRPPGIDEIAIDRRRVPVRGVGLVERKQKPGGALAALFGSAEAWGGVDLGATGASVFMLSLAAAIVLLAIDCQHALLFLSFHLLLHQPAGNHQLHSATGRSCYGTGWC